MKIIRLFGGLGNQMFQYAFGQVIQRDVAYDVSWFNEIKGNQNVTQRSYELGFFQCSPWLLSSEELLMILNSANQLGGEDAYQFVIEIPANIYNPELLKKENAIFMGYFQCYQYYDKIRPQLLSEFKPIQKIPQKKQRNFRSYPKYEQYFRTYPKRRLHQISTYTWLMWIRILSKSNQFYCF